MVRALTSPAPVVRATIAARWLGAREGTARIGRVELRPHQVAAVERVRALMDAHGGALLADDVGLGKTYVAAALAREHSRVIVVAPAVLRAMWRDALRDVDARAEVTSWAALSRGSGPMAAADLLILDEAHHARTPSTRRHRRVAQLARGARVLLLTATPIHNARRDLAALFALFLGARAWSMDDAALARLIVRRERDDVREAALPDADPPRWLNVGDDAPLLSEILALPPPLPPADGGDGGALVAWGLARQWASSRAALVGALRRRLARAAALDAALADGHRPTRAELAAWRGDDESIQLALPLAAADPAASCESMREAVRAHESAARALLARARAGDEVDEARAAHLRALRAAHPGEKIVAFTQFADTALALFRRLRADGGVAVLTAGGARVAGGKLNRGEALARFAPAAHRATPPPAAERIDLLLATDLLSEGVNLQDASVVVHLDLPWTPARLEQRVGRSRRLGARHARTTVYALAPPAGAEVLLRVEERLRSKLRAAERAVGIAGVILPPPLGAGSSGGERACAEASAPAESGSAAPLATPCAPERAPAARTIEELARELGRWRDAVNDPPPLDPDAMLVSVGRAPRRFILALAREGEEWRLAGSVNDGALSEEPHTVLEAARLASVMGAPGGAPGARAPAADVARAEEELAAVLRRVEGWAGSRAARLAAAGAIEIHGAGRRRALRRIAAITTRAPHHRRPELARLAAHARLAVTAPLGIGAERVLDTLVNASLPDDAWLRALGAFGDANGGRRVTGDDAPRVVAVLAGFR